MRNICSILFILFPLHWRGARIFFDLFLISLNNKNTTLVLSAHMGLMLKDVAERIQGYHSHGTGHLYLLMGTSHYGKEKDKGLLKISLKACDGHLHLQTQMRAVCTESIAASHILPFTNSQMRVLTGPQQRAAPCEDTVLLLLL